MLAGWTFALLRSLQIPVNTLRGVSRYRVPTDDYQRHAAPAECLVPFLRVTTPFPRRPFYCHKLTALYSSSSRVSKDLEQSFRRTT
jgi:hypothetical protein